MLILGTEGCVYGEAGTPELTAAQFALREWECSISCQRRLPFAHTHSQPISLADSELLPLLRGCHPDPSHVMAWGPLTGSSRRSGLHTQGRCTAPAGLLQQPPGSGVSMAVEERGECHCHYCDPHSLPLWHHHILAMTDGRADPLWPLGSPFTLPQLQGLPQCFWNIPGSNTRLPLTLAPAGPLTFGASPADVHKARLPFLSGFANITCSRAFPDNLI